MGTRHLCWIITSPSFAVYLMNKTGGKRKMFITREKYGKLIEQLFSTIKPFLRGEIALGLRVLARALLSVSIMCISGDGQ
jgi:hypothetical protein